MNKEDRERLDRLERKVDSILTGVKVMLGILPLFLTIIGLVIAFAR